MSILIKGMEMPTSRGEYVLLLYVDSDGTATVEGSYCQFEGEPFEAVPVPDHGDLIDRDALMQQIEHDTPLSAVFEKTMRRYLSNAPTVLKAEEGET